VEGAFASDAGPVSTGLAGAVSWAGASMGGMAAMGDTLGAGAAAASEGAGAGMCGPALF